MHKQVKKLNVFLWPTFTQTCKWDIALATIAMHFYSNKKGTNEISIRSNSDTYKDNNASYSQPVIWHILINWDNSGSTFSNVRLAISHWLINNHNISPQRQIIFRFLCKINLCLQQVLLKGWQMHSTNQNASSHKSENLLS